MPIIKGKPNPLNLFNCRKFEFPAEHLYYLTLNNFQYNLESAITTWIEHNLSGKYYIGRGVNTEDTPRAAIVIGFENQKEASYFQLACPLLKY